MEHGPISDIGYEIGYYPEQSPWHIRLASLLGGYQPPAIGPGLRYLELGCGIGFTVLVLAACNPDWEVCGIELMPEQLAIGRKLADEAGLSNLRLIQADIATLVDSSRVTEVPDADIVSMHGFWTWIPPAVRQGTVRLLQRKLRPGGIVQMSYNSLPCWQPMLGVQRLIRAAGLESGGAHSTQQVRAGLDLAQSLFDAGAVQLQTRFVAGMLDDAKTDRPAYLSHEYMAAGWNPTFHAEVATALHAADLEWGTPARPNEAFAEWLMTESQRALWAQAGTSELRELIKDSCIFRGLRNDLFFRSPRRLDDAPRRAALAQTMLAAIKPADAFPDSLAVHRGDAIMLSPSVYQPVARALADQPRTVADLLGIDGVREAFVAQRSTADIPEAELAAVLVANGHAIPVGPDRDEADSRAGSLNRIAVRSLFDPAHLSMRLALACARYQVPVPCGMVEAQVWGAPTTEPDRLAAVLAGEGADDARRTMLLDYVLRTLKSTKPVWRALTV